MKFTTVLAIAMATAMTGPATADKLPSPEEMWKIIQQQQQEIEALKKGQQAAVKQAADADEKAEAAVVAVEESAAGGSGGNWADRTTIGGYGELHYNNVDARDPANDYKEIDFHRFVLFFGHEFTDDLRFHSELELEHALAGDGADKPGEVELEQAYIEYDIRDNLQTRGGVFILPIGILNETHEPNTFYGVERNDVENIIIPSTWWAAGAGLSGQHASGISWDLAVHEGLEMPTSGSSAFRVRSGRQKSAEANAEDLAWTGRVRYTGIPGLSLGASINYQTDASQVSGDDLESGLLLEGHMDYQKGPFGLRALYAEWDLDITPAGLALVPGADRQQGWYIEPSYKPLANVGVYARYEDVEGARTHDRFDQWEVGVNYWPHEDVVLKADYRSRDHDLTADAGRDFDAFDLGIGYQF
ncbi:MAG: OprO/OprP family phosphate-selective porin [Gammaproteobacteria bacterium]|nr:OprO/OprP family phosphate-selective porin [Gammaproteobacteria bacterium]